MQEGKGVTKVGTVMMLSGLIEVTVKAKSQGEQTETVKVVTEGPKYDKYLLEQDSHGLK